MTWLQGILHAHPEIAFFLVLGLGYLLGKIALGSFKLGAAWVPSQLTPKLLHVDLSEE